METDEDAEGKVGGDGADGVDVVARHAVWTRRTSFTFKKSAV